MSCIVNAIHNILMIILLQVPVAIDYPKKQRFLQNVPVGNYTLCKQALNEHFCTSIQKSYRKILTYFNALCTGCLTKQLTHITWHNFVNFNAFLIHFQI